jgi:hypothetical protein
MSDEIEEPVTEPVEPSGWRLVDLPTIQDARDRFDIGLDIMLLEFAGEENPNSFRKRWARRLIDEPSTRQRVITAAGTLARGREAFQQAAIDQTPVSEIAMAEYLAALAELVQIWAMTETRPTTVGVDR